MTDTPTPEPGLIERARRIAYNAFLLSQNNLSDSAKGRVMSAFLGGDSDHNLGVQSALAALTASATALADMKAERDAAFETAANVCATLAETALSDGDSFDAALLCEAAIRALKARP